MVAMKIHTLHLQEIPFEAIEKGHKVIESRLFDEKRKQIKVGDEIQFKNNRDDRTIRVKVTKLHTYQNFHELFSHNGFHKFGGVSMASLLEQINQYYTQKDQEKYGVLGIEFKPL